MVTKNQQWLKISLFIYFFLTIGLIIAIIFNFLYINSTPTEDCPNVNDCPDCPVLPCAELVNNTCPIADLALSGLGLPNEGFLFYLLGSVAQTPTTSTDIGSFRTVISSEGVQANNGVWYYRMENLSEQTAAIWRYSSQILNFFQNLGSFRISQTAISGAPTFFSVILSGAIFNPTDVVEGTIDYVGGNILFNVGVGPTTYYLYLADADTEIPSLNLSSGFYPVWTSVAPVLPANPNFSKYIWTLYQIQ